MEKNLSSKVIAKRTEFLELSTEILGKGNNLRFRALGGSMHPFIKNGEVVEVKPGKSSEIKVGEVVFYRSSWGGMVAHRVVKKKKENGKVILITKGDFSARFDEPVLPEQVVGKVVSVERRGRSLKIDQGFPRLRGFLWVKITVIIPRFYPTLRQVKVALYELLRPVVRKFQDFKVYRVLIKKIIPVKFSYQITPLDDGASPEIYGSKKDFENGQPPGILQKEKRKLEGPAYRLQVKSEEKIVGNVIINRFSQNGSSYQGWWLWGLWVGFRYRGLGLGERLVEMILKKAVEGGAKEVKLLVFEDSQPSLKLYQKLGFKQTSIPEIEKELEKEAQRESRRRIIMFKNLEVKSDGKASLPKASANGG